MNTAVYDKTQKNCFRAKKQGIFVIFKTVFKRRNDFRRGIERDTAYFIEIITEVIYGVNTAKSVFDRALREIVSKLDKYIYALEDISLLSDLGPAMPVVEMLISQLPSFISPSAISAAVCSETAPNRFKVISSTPSRAYKFREKYLR